MFVTVAILIYKGSSKMSNYNVKSLKAEEFISDAEILETILMLQQRGEECDEDNSCTRPFLGPSNNII